MACWVFFFFDNSNFKNGIDRKLRQRNEERKKIAQNYAEYKSKSIQWKVFVKVLRS